MNLVVKQTNTFRKTLKRLSAQQKLALDDAIKKVMENPMLGQQKKGDLAFLRVYKFKILKQEMLLEYCFNDEKTILTLLMLGPHENFYRDIKHLK